MREWENKIMRERSREITCFLFDNIGRTPIVAIYINPPLVTDSKMSSIVEFDWAVSPTIVPIIAAIAVYNCTCIAWNFVYPASIKIEKSPIRFVLEAVKKKTRQEIKNSWSEWNNQF